LFVQFRILFLYETAEAIRLDLLESAKASDLETLSGALAAAPQHLRFERPPVAERIPSFTLSSGEGVEGKIKYYDYGVVSVEFELSFDADWTQIISSSVQWASSTELESRSKEILGAALKRVSKALIKPFESWLTEDYYIIQLPELRDANDRPVPASDLLASHAAEIAQLIRAESLPLSDAERQEVLQSSISYSQYDLLVVGWTGALVYGRSSEAALTIQLLEYANSQLLEFRYYDSLLTNLLNDVYRLMERQQGIFAAWRLSREAAHVNTIRLDVMELTERVDNAIKFLSDMFQARLYGVISAKVGVPDYRRLVDQKLRTAGELYRYMVDQFNQSRSFILELAVVIILVIEIVFLFRGSK
jgi:hypothetical protein